MKRLHIPITTMLFTLLTGLTVPSTADDTDLYFNNMIEIPEETLEAARPKILLTFDNSGSMGNRIVDEETGKPLASGETRLDQLQTATTNMLDGVDEVEIGYAPFTAQNEGRTKYGNVPILYPVAYVDAPIAEIEGEGNLIIPVTAPITEATDDAEEKDLDGSKEVVLNDTTLEMIQAPETDGVGITVESKIDSIKNDAREYLGNGYGGNYGTAIGTVKANGEGVVPLGGYSGSETMPDPDKLNLWKGETLVGLRFRGEDGNGVGIPQGATITKAVVKLTAYDIDEEKQGDLSLAIQAGYDDANGDVFKNDVNYSVSNHRTESIVKDREGEAITIFWNNVPHFAEGRIYETPAGLKTLIQKIVDQGCEIVDGQKTCDATTGWQYGNNISLFFERKRVDDNGDPLPRTSSQLTTGMRAIKTRDSDNLPEAPRLSISWFLPEKTIDTISKRDSISSRANGKHVQRKEPKGNKHYQYIYLGNDPEDSNKPFKVGIRFEELSIPPNATIKDAKIIFTHQSGQHQGTEESGRAPLDLKIYAEKVPNSKTLNSSPSITQRIQSRTDNTVEWKNIEKPPDAFKNKPTTATEDGKTFETEDLTEILQEIVKQKEWQPGNAVTFLFEKMGSSMGSRRIVVQADNTSGSDFNNKFTSVKPSEETLPRLSVTFSVADPEDMSDTGAQDEKRKQVVGLRFQSVTVPRGATVLSARINFTSKDTVATRAKLAIQTEIVNYGPDIDVEPFTTETGNISSRTLYPRTPSETWDIRETWEAGEEYSTDDLTDLVQQVVNHSGWCGGKTSMAFVISAKDEDDTPFRSVFAFDDAPDKAPVLQVEYDAKTVPEETCVNQQKTWSIQSVNDDAEEFLSGSDEIGYLELPGNLELGKKTKIRRVGLRFTDIAIKPDSKINRAWLTFVSKSSHSEDVELIIKGQAGDAEPFEDVIFNLRDRPKTGTSVTWEPEAWEKGLSYKTPDIGPIIQQIVNHSSWEAKSDLALFIEYKKGAHRQAYPFTQQNAHKAVKLTVQVEGELEDAGLETVRDRLKRVVNSIEPSQFTNVVEALFESGLYFLGKEVNYGKSREGYSAHRVSHPATYEGGTLERNDQCTDILPYDEDCADERITGTPVYKSPVKEIPRTNKKINDCFTIEAKNYIVLLTDGQANVNNAVESIEELIGQECGKAKDAQKCGVELARYLANGKDSDARLHNGPTVCLHTIGFQLGKGWEKTPVMKNGKPLVVPVLDKDGNPVLKKNGTPKTKKVYEEDENGEFIMRVNENKTKNNEAARQFLKDLAKNSCKESKYFDATSADELQGAFDKILDDAKVDSASFAAPTVAVNANNQLFHNNDRIFALFKPSSEKPSWSGNIKKYQSCTSAMVDRRECQHVGEIIGQDKKSIHDPDGKVSENAHSFWSKEKDGSIVTKGGAGEQIPIPGGRKIYTYLPGDDELPPEPGKGFSLTFTEEHELIEVWRNEDKKELLQEAIGDLSKLNEQQGFSEITTDRVVDWILGENIEANSDGLRWRFADPLHSSPVAIAYAYDKKRGKELASGEELLKLVVGTNDGLLHMIDAENGKEDWAFLPAEMLPVQPQIVGNYSITSKRIYGIDGTPSVWIEGDDKVVNKDESVHLFVGMRRGGSNYYALDITNPDEPTLMWTIKGTVKTVTEKIEDGRQPSYETQTPSPGFEKLAQTWSQPKPTQVLFNGEAKDVLIFAGGFHPKLEEGSDLKYASSDRGNAIYMVDLSPENSGQLLWWASNPQTESDDDDGGSDTIPFLELPGMDYAIPSDVKLVDTDGDYFTDRLYVGDLGGQVWRIDIDYRLGKADSLGKADPGAGARLASIGDEIYHDQRRFFYPPAVYLDESDGETITWVAIITGTRPEPKKEKVHDTFYVFRDRLKESLRSLKEDGTLTIEDCHTKLEGQQPKFCTVTNENIKAKYANTTDRAHNQMYDVNTYLDTMSEESATSDGSDDQVEVTLDESELKNSLGWYLQLKMKYDSIGKIVEADGDYQGEKGLDSPFILEDKGVARVYFTTYTPWKENDPLLGCQGATRFYSMALTGADLITRPIGKGVVPVTVIVGPKGIGVTAPPGSDLEACGMTGCGLLSSELGKKKKPGEPPEPCKPYLICNELQRTFWQQIFD